MKVLFVDTVHPCLEEELLRHGYTTSHFTSNNLNEFKNIAGNYEGFVIRSKFVLTQEILNDCKNLRFIARAGAGMENIDVPYAQSLGITCINSPEGNRDAVGEHALGMLLMLLHHLKRADTEVRNGIWRRAENRGTEIMGKTIGIIGYGNTGSRFARKLSGFDAHILVYDPYKTTIADSFVQRVELAQIFEQADIVSLHIPLTPETHYMVDEAFISSFHKPIYFINTSRGKNVKTTALVQGLQSGKILGACLDVLEYEASSFEQVESNQLPEAFNWLKQASNVILAPHIAGWTHESNRKMSEFLAQKIIGQFGSRKGE